MRSMEGEDTRQRTPDNTLYYNPLGGLGFSEYGLIASRFRERGRQGRLIRLASDLGANMAYGVDENTALVVTNAGTASNRKLRGRSKNSVSKATL